MALAVNNLRNYNMLMTLLSALEIHNQICKMIAFMMKMKQGKTYRLSNCNKGGAETYFGMSVVK